jgi:hypothetical protein
METKVTAVIGLNQIYSKNRLLHVLYTKRVVSTGVQTLQYSYHVRFILFLLIASTLIKVLTLYICMRSRTN